MSIPAGSIPARSIPDEDTCYRAVCSRDPRFDGWFFTAVRTTGIYCRPSCPARTPYRANVSFHPSAASAQRAGYRACRRCRPDASPGSPDWDRRADPTGRALRLIGDGVIDRDGVDGLAARLGYSPRHLHRLLVAGVGAGPLALARAQRAQAARTLLETTDLPVTDIAFAAGFASVRQYNATVRAVFDTTPSALRAARRCTPDGSPGSLTVRLPYRQPMDVAAVLDFLGAHAVAGLERYADGVYTRIVSAPRGPALVSVAPAPLTASGAGAVHCTIRLGDLRDLTSVVARVRRLLDLDADPDAVDAALAADPELAPLVAKRPGLRVPGSVDGFETAVRTVVGQQISLAGARTVLGRIVAEHGRVEFADAAAGEPGWRAFPDAATLAAVDPDTLPMPRARGRAVVAIAGAFAAGLALDPGSDRAELRRTLLALPGVGPWTADYLAMRCTGDSDVLLDSDLVIRRAAAELGIPLGGGRPEWAPWRSYATCHLWSHLYADIWSAAR